MSSSPWRLAVLPPLPVEAYPLLFGDHLAGLDVELVAPDPRDAGGVRAALRDADLALGDWTAQLRLGPAEAAAAGRLAFVQQPSAGVEHIDLSAFAEHGVPVANTGDANAVSVAEWCLGAAFDLLRSMTWADAAVRAGDWPQLQIAERGCVELAGRRVGVVGFGPVGVACAQRFAALGATVSYWSRRRRDPAAEHGATYRELDDLLATSDVLVVVVALAPETTGLLDRRRLGLLPAGAYLVNAARGAVLDEDALVDRLRAGALAGAALDVYSEEPLPASSPLRGLDRVLLSPHVAGATVEGRTRIVAAAVDNLRRAMTGQPVRNVLNGADPLVRRRPA